MEPMKEQYAASMLIVQPQIMKNDNPTGPHDLLIGDASTFYNEILGAIGVNVTINTHYDVGSCVNLVTGNCTGIREDLQLGISDFSVIALPGDDYDIRVYPPFISGPYVYDAFLRFGGLPETEGRESAINALFTLTQIPYLMYVLVFLVFVLSFVCYNYSSRHHGFKQRITWIIMIGMATMHGNPRPTVLVRRRLSQISAALTAFFFYQIYEGCSTCDRLSITPPYYLHSVREVAESNRTVLLFKGHRSHQIYEHHEEKVFRDMVRRGYLYDASLPDTFNRIATGVIGSERGMSFGNDIVVRVIQSFICFNTDYSRNSMVRFGKPFIDSPAYATYAKNIDSWLRARLDDVYMRFTEGGFYQKQNTDPIPKVSSIMNPEKLLMCLTAMNTRPVRDLVVEMLSLESFEIVILLFSAASVTNLSALACELLFHTARKSLRRKRVQDNNNAWVVVHSWSY